MWQRLEVFCIQAAEELDEGEECECEVDNSNSTLVPIQNIIDLTKFSTLNQLIAMTAYVSQFIHNCRQGTTTSRITGLLTVSGLTQAHLQWLKQIPGSVFADEVRNLKVKGNRLPLVRQLRLFLDSNGSLQCGRCIHNVPISELAKFLYLLSSSS